MLMWLVMSARLLSRHVVRKSFVNEVTLTFIMFFSNIAGLFHLYYTYVFIISSYFMSVVNYAYNCSICMFIFV